MVAGFVAGASALGLLDVPIESEVAQRVTEVALVLLLFSDAARLDLHALRHELGWPSRLLLIGLPLTMLAGAGVGLLVFPGMALASVFLLSIMLSSTDAALGQKVVTDASVPARVRQALDVESGLNDGLAVPFFLVALDLANAELTTGVTWAVVSNAAEQIGWGLAAGVTAGLLGGLLFRAAERRGWIGGEWRQIVVLATALLAYAFALTLGGSGFIAAFVGGLAFGHFSGQRGSAVTLFTEETGGLFAAVTWIGFGALALGWAIPHITWQVVLYAALSLTLVRMLPVAIAMAGRGVAAPDRGLHRLVRAARPRLGGVRPPRRGAGRARGADAADSGRRHRGAQRGPPRPDLGAPRERLSPLVREPRGGPSGGRRSGAGDDATLAASVHAP